MEPLTIIVSIIFLIMTLAMHSSTKDALNDPDNKHVVSVDEIRPTAILKGYGPWHVIIMRQSGYVHSDYIVEGTSNDAIRKMNQTFKRAQIDAVAIVENDIKRLKVNRAFYNGNGRQEGKRVGGAVIKPYVEG